MIVDGKQIAEEIYAELRRRIATMSRAPRLTVFTCEPNFETKKFLAIKEQKSREIGIALSVVTFPDDISEAACVAAIRDAARSCEGIIVQLPFPHHISREALIAAIPPTHDVDAFNLNDSEVVSPVIGAIAEILTFYRVPIAHKNAVVIGYGMLVGRPAETWLREHGAHVTVVTKESSDIASVTTSADVIVLGAGEPGILTPEMIQSGVVILDAGTSEEGGVLRGDADTSCADKAALFTPVPGGIGPVTIAILLKNLVILASRKT